MKIFVPRKWLTRAREEKGYSIESLANTLSCNSKKLVNIENGKVLPDVLLARRIAGVLEFNYMDFYH